MTADRKKTWFCVAAGVIAALALGLRLWDLGRRGLCHPENYVPGIPMPWWVYIPPPRTTFASLMGSILKDAHPPLYYLAMFTWTKVFGIDVVSLRLPSAILGAASVLVLWRLALREMGRVAALVAALLLALHGTHVYWSQTARMYAPASFLSLLSTLMLWRVLEDGRLRYHVLYAASAAAALWTQIYCWPVLLGQMIWSTLRSIREKRAPAALPAQFAAIVLSMPVIELLVYQWRQNVCPEPMAEYFEFGYLFWSGAFSFGSLPAPPVQHAVLLALGIATALVGILARPAPEIAASASAGPALPRPFLWSLLAVGAGVSASLVRAAMKAFPPGTPRYASGMAVAALPLAVAALFPLVQGWCARLAAREGGLVRALADRTGRISPLLALLPVGIMMLIGSRRDVFVSRGAMTYVPYLLLVCVAGLTKKRLLLPWAAWLSFIALVGLHVLSLRFSFASEHSPRDYKGFAAALRKELRPDDLVMITNLYSDPPLLYYFPDRFDQFVPADWEAAVRAHPGARVWAVLFEDQEMAEGMTAAVKGRPERLPAVAAGSKARLFLP